MTTSTPRAEPTDGSPPKKSRLKVWVLRIGMIVLSPLLILFLIEMIWQLVGDSRYPDYDEWLAGRPPHFELAKLGLLRGDEDPEIAFTLNPGFEATVEENVYRVNANGLRGAEVTVEKPTGVKRVLILGDSYAFGFGVSEKDMIAAQLQKSLASKHAGIQVLTLGAPGYQTGQQEHVLRRDGLRFEPDVVVLVYYANDNMTPSMMYDPRVKVIYTDVLPLPVGLKQFLARSILYSKISRAYSLTLSPDDEKIEPGTTELDARGPRHWPVTSNRIHRIATMCERRKIRFVLVAIPALVDSIKFMKRDYICNLDHDRVLAFADEEGIGTIDVREHLMTRGKPIEMFPIEQLFVSWDPKPRDSHFNAEGYRLLVHALADHIETQSLLR